MLPILVEKALNDAGYDLVEPTTPAGWFQARVSGSQAVLAIRSEGGQTLIATPEPGLVHRVGLVAAQTATPPGMRDVGLATRDDQLYEALRLLHALQAHRATLLLAALEDRLAAIPETERTREVRQRIGQDLFREALMNLWEGRCALCDLALPPALLRASHAKPWARATDEERLDPFNGLLLAVQFDALFDQGLIAFDDEGQTLISSRLAVQARQFLKLDALPRLRFVLPGHRKYLRYHRAHVFLP
ncbi:HNH endonuclease [Thiobacter aerophilum]|uniref:HNH endonuclease n=1 Tax=Thiobacter aerophilum TaxID=3121275 RepID=A0ABV0EFQ0_9BURK